ncbi:hypothetical protein WMY93_032968 [Mugilogobius chulae]|uniref:EGF-like domain-containing protein n=1 Tax=Mugilogobius chulae TaxID=88201 RepID=A0AAW0MM14_9GOBI
MNVQDQKSYKTRKDDSSKAKPDVYAVSKPGEGEGLAESPAPCPEDYAQFCEHGQCEMRHNLPTCRCESAYGGPQCDQLLDFNILYVVPSGQKLHYVLIAAIIGAVQIAVIVAVVMCFTRRCNNRARPSAEAAPGPLLIGNLVTDDVVAPPAADDVTSCLRMMSLPVP